MEGVKANVYGGGESKRVWMGVKQTCMEGVKAIK